jgi:hypothetical protein
MIYPPLRNDDRSKETHPFHKHKEHMHGLRSLGTKKSTPPATTHNSIPLAPGCLSTHASKRNAHVYFSGSTNWMSYAIDRVHEISMGHGSELELQEVSKLKCGHHGMAFLLVENRNTLK